MRTRYLHRRGGPGAKGATSLRVARMHTENTIAGERKKLLLPPMLAHIPRKQQQKLLEMKTISHLQIKTEELRKSSCVDQCHSCQTFGQTASFPSAAPRCVKCVEVI
jgi:hypothetical protein